MHIMSARTLLTDVHITFNYFVDAFDEHLQLNCESSSLPPPVPKANSDLLPSVP